MKKSIAIVVFFTLLSKIIGFGRDITLSFFYGASNVSDAYIISYTVPGIIFPFLGAAIASNYIPIYSKIEKRNSINEANIFTNNMISVFLILCTILILLGLVFTPTLVKLLAFGFDNETLSLAVSFTRISMFGIYISVLIHIFASYLQIKNNFLIPAIMGIPFNFVIVLSIFLSTKIDLILLPFGYFLAFFAQLLLLIPFVKKEKFKFKFIINLQDRYLKRFMYISIPVFLGISVNEINVLIDRTIASQVTVGGISALSYASRLNLFIQGIFVLSLTTVIFPTISKMVANDDMSGLKGILSKTISSVNLLIFPMTFAVVVLSKPIISIFYGHGVFNSNSIQLTAGALLFYSIGLIGFSLREVLARVFYSMQDTKTPMVNASIALVINIVLNIILSKYMGINGLALATSIAAIFATLLLFISLRKKIGRFGIKNILNSSIKILFASLIMGFVIKFSFIYFNNSYVEILALFVSSLIGALIYILIIYFMKIDEIDFMLVAIKNKIKR